MKITRIGKDKNIDIVTTRIEFTVDGEDYVITPDHEGFRIYKTPFSGGIIVKPCCANEVTIK